jgi:hypothetical protein
MTWPRRQRVGLIVGLVLLVPTTADASWIGRSFFELLRAADDALVVHVDSTGGPQYGQWAQVSVERRLKGTVRPDTIRLPFSYEGWPSPTRPNYRRTLSTALDRRFATGQRLLVLVVRQPLADTTAPTTGGFGRSNPFAAATRYQVYPYPSDTRFDLRRTALPVVDVVERLIRADRAATAAAQAEALRPLLGHDAPTVRRYAAGAARELAPDPLAPLLLRRFERETERRPRRLVTEALARLAHPGITPALLDAAPGYAPALRALARRADPAARDPLMELYEARADTAETETVRRLLRALEAHVTPADLPTLRRWYEEAGTTDRRAALLSLIAATRSAPALSFLTDVLRTGAPSLRVTVAETAGRDSLDALAPALLQQFERERNDEVRRALTDALAGLAHPAITPALLDAAPTYRPALQALARRTDTSLAAPLVRLYETVADTAGPRTMRALRSALGTHLSPKHAPTVVRWYRAAPSDERRDDLLRLAAPLRAPASDSLLTTVATTGATPALRAGALRSLREHGPHRPALFARALRHDDDPRVRQAALRALGAAGNARALDALRDHAPPPCAVTHEPGLLGTAWDAVTGWFGPERPPEAPWSPIVFDVLRQMGRGQAADRQLVRAAVASYLSCARFVEVRLFAAKTLFALGPEAARPALRRRLRAEPSARVRAELRHLLWMGGRRTDG